MIEFNKRQSQIYEIALAALTAEPYAFASRNTDMSKESQYFSASVFNNAWGEEYTMPLYTTPPAQLLRPVELPDETDMKWRDLALQFDGHRMQAISLLKMIINDASDDQYLSVRNFLKSGPLPGEEVLQNRIAEIAEVQRLNATAQPVSDCILKIADGLESLLWPNMGDGNRALIQAAIEVLRTLPVEYHVAYGFTLMPKEITLEMAEAAAPYHADCKQYYRALVAAAPGGQDS